MARKNRNRSNQNSPTHGFTPPLPQGYPGMFPQGFHPAMLSGMVPWPNGNYPPPTQQPKGSQGGRRRGRQEDLNFLYENQNERQDTRSFAGLGPRNYRRSDDRIRDDIFEALTVNPRIDASDIEVSVRQGGLVELAGNVTDRTQKLLVEHLIGRIPGVQDITNQIRVVKTQENLDRQGTSVRGPEYRDHGRNAQGIRATS